MKRPRALYVPVMVLVSILAGLAGGRALAWVGLGPKWPSPAATYDTHTLSGPWRDVADFGADQWTNVTNSAWVWTSDGSSNNDITTGGIDGSGNVLAVTYITYSGSTITRITINFDSAENWYLGSGSPGGSQIDGRSVSAHEFGHGLGLGHTQSGNCPSGSSRATMCSSYPTGTNYMRSLEADDRDGVASLYPGGGGGPTDTPTATHTATNTPTPTDTPVPTNTPKGSIGMPVDTETPTPPPTATPTATTAPSASPTPTAPSGTATSVPTNTPTTAPPTRTPTSPPMCIGC